MKRCTAMLVTLVAGGVLAASVSAAGTGSDPLRLVLKRSDVPAGTRLTAARYPSTDQAYTAMGFPGTKTAEFLAEIPRGGTETLLVGGRVMAVPTAAEARRLFAIYRRADIAYRLRLARTIRLPAYGDEQSAFFQTNPSVRIDLRVRTGAVVWRVEVKWAGTEDYTRAQTLAELQTYAAKLKRRVGNG